MVQVPNVQGMTAKDATKALEAAGFQVQENDGLIGGGSNGTVQSYSPTGQAPQGSTITINVGLLSGG